MNHFSLFDEKPETFENFTNFYAALKKNSTRKNIKELPSQSCTICEGKIDIHTILRRCKVGPMPCDSHECKCSEVDNEIRYYQACSSCLANMLWNNSNSRMKELGR
jgi:hypothetical protein